MDRIPFRRTKKEIPPPGDEVKEQYDAKINQFLHKVDEPRPGWLQSIGKNDVDPLERLFTWGDKVWTERNKLQSQFSAAEKRIKELEAELSGTQRKLGSIENDNRTMQTRHQEELDDLKNRHSTVIKREKNAHGNEVKRLVGQLLVNQDDNTSWTDDKLKFRFQQLQNAINSLVSPRNKEFRVPQGTRLGDLDPTGFLQRASTSKVHFLLQSTIWAILYDNFFSMPFGFGIAGHGVGQKKLLDMYLSWAKLVGGVSSDGMLGKYG